MLSPLSCSSPDTPPVPSAASCPTILVVDDNPVDRRLAEGILERRIRCRLTRAGNGAEALRAIEESPPDVVLTDLLMPEMDGLQLVEAIREKHAGVPVILMTAHGSEDIAIHALRIGAANYVPKKNLARELSETVEQVLGAARAGSQKDRLLGCVSRLDTEFELDNDPDLARVLVAHVLENLARLGTNDRTRVRIGVALEEALLNGLYHGNLEVCSDLKARGDRSFERQVAERRQQSPYRERRLRVQAGLCRDEVRFVVRDEGPGFDLAILPDPTDPENLSRPSGRGLLLIRNFMDEVRHNDRGNEITLLKRLGTPRPT